MELSDAGLILKKLRDAEGFSLRRQAIKLDIGASYLCDISYGNRRMTVPVLQKIVKAYKYQVKDDFYTLASGCYDKNLIDRYKLRNHISDNTQAVKDLIFVMTGENL